MELRLLDGDAGLSNACVCLMLGDRLRLSPFADYPLTKSWRIRPCFLQALEASDLLLAVLPIRIGSLPMFTTGAFTLTCEHSHPWPASKPIPLQEAFAIWCCVKCTPTGKGKGQGKCRGNQLPWIELEKKSPAWVLSDTEHRTF